MIHGAKPGGKAARPFDGGGLWKFPPQARNGGGWSTGSPARRSGCPSAVIPPWVWETPATVGTHRASCCPKALTRVTTVRRWSRWQVGKQLRGCGPGVVRQVFCNEVQLAPI